MTPAIRCLVLLTAVSALNGCSDGESTASKHTSEKGMQRHVEAPLAAMKKPEPTAILPALTTTAPAAPPSVADLKAMPKPEELAPNSEDNHSEESGQALPDFDRPLDPSEVSVDRFVLARDVKGREPVDETDLFTTDTKKIFAFVQLANDKEPYAFRVHWEKVGEPASIYGVKLAVPTAPRFRTWSWTAIKREPGTYRAVLRTLSGQEITSREFVIEAAESLDQL